MTTYVPVKDGALAPGNYRLRGYVQSVYNRGTIAMIEVLFRAKFGLKKIDVTGFHTTPPLYSAHNSGPGRWSFVVDFTVKESLATAGIDPRVLYALAVVILTAAVAARLSSVEISRVIEASADAAGEVIDHAKDALTAIFNPATMIVAALIVALLVGAIAKKG